MGKRTFFWVAFFFILFWVLVFGSGLGLLNYAHGQFPGFQTHRSKKLGIEFNYQDILKVSEKDGVVTIEHSVPFEHYDPCDRSGRNQKSKKILDFYAKITFLPLTPTELFVQQVMERNEAGDVKGVKNTVRVTYGKLGGFRLYNGEGGCGPHSYFFQLSPENVLRVDRWPAPEFKEMTESEKQMRNRLRQIILPEQEEHFFREILTSLTVGDR
ncbi:MAG: hypothetical protein G01um101444_195 [Parcubacteria group bacterium Gr01-1014_44]|nr:MAG: hypothetical protein G01um101444_195 [Parcubacteria group bacterium Gr01-1014_44]